MKPNDFKIVNLANQKSYTKGVNIYAPYSDFNFVSLFSWNTDNSARYFCVENGTVIQLPDYITGEPVYSVLGISDVDVVLHQVLEIAGTLHLVPEETVAHIMDKNAFEISEDLDNFDYIYDAESIANLSGGKLKKKRNKVHKFISDLGQNITVYNTLSPTPRDKELLLSLFDRWTEENESLLDLATPERSAFMRLIENFQKLNVILTCVYLNNNLVGFSINELLDNGYAICHFEKAMLVHENIYTFVANQAALELIKHGVKYLNWEQDLGIPGLRNSKQSYQPLSYLKKYTIRRK